MRRFANRHLLFGGHCDMGTETDAMDPWQFDPEDERGEVKT
jgi:hypothetical protein